VQQVLASPLRLAPLFPSLDFRKSQRPAAHRALHAWPASCAACTAVGTTLEAKQAELGSLRVRGVAQVGRNLGVGGNLDVAQRLKVLDYTELTGFRNFGSAVLNGSVSALSSIQVRTPRALAQPLSLRLNCSRMAGCHAWQRWQADWRTALCQC